MSNLFSYHERGYNVYIEIHEFVFKSIMSLSIPETFLIGLN